jgi:hypothetical protein
VSEEPPFSFAQTSVHFAVARLFNVIVDASQSTSLLFGNDLIRSLFDFIRSSIASSRRRRAYFVIRTRGPSKRVEEMNRFFHLGKNKDVSSPSSPNFVKESVIITAIIIKSRSTSIDF